MNVFFGSRRLALYIGAVVVVACSCQGQAGAQDFRKQPTYGKVSLNAGFTPDPRVKSLTAGGNQKTSVGGVTAYIATAPDYNLNYRKGAYKYLYIYAESTADITLLVNLPNTRYLANDDGGSIYKSGLNPVLKLPAETGLYNIWVGVYAEGERKTAPAKLYISELEPNFGDGVKPGTGTKPTVRSDTTPFTFAVIDSKTLAKVQGATATFNGVTLAGQRRTAHAADRQTHYATSLSPGRYIITVAKPGYKTTTKQITLDADPRKWFSPQIALVRGQAPVQPLGRTYTYHLRAVEVPSGNLISGLTVTIYSGNVKVATAQELRQPYLGAYNYTALLKPGKYKVTYSKQGYDTDTGEFTISDGGVKQNVGLRQKRPPVRPTATATLWIQVVDDKTSRAVPAPTVRVKSGDALYPVTTVQGWYQSKLKPGTYTLSVSKEGYVAQEIPVQVGTKQNIQRIRLKRPDTPEKLVQLWVKVVDDKSGLEVANPLIVVSAGGAEAKVFRSNEAKSKGWYYSRVKSGIYTVAASKAGYASQSVQVEIGSKYEQRTIRLKRDIPRPNLFALLVQVLDERGKPFPNANVTISSGATRIPSVQRNGAHTSKVKPGVYVVKVKQKGYAQQTLNVVIRDTDVTRQIKLKRIKPTTTPTGKLSLTIVVIDIKGKKIDGANVSLVTPEIEAKFVEAAGAYTAGGLKRGPYTVAVAKQGYQSATKAVSIGFANSKRIVILKSIPPVPPPVFVLRVAALNEKQEPILSFQASADPGITVKSDRERFYTARLKPGRYEVQVRKKGYETQERFVTIRSSDEQLNFQLKPLRKVSPPGAKTAPLTTRPGGLQLKPGKKRTVAPASGTRGGGLSLKPAKGKRVRTPIVETRPGGLGLTPAKRKTDRPYTPVNEPDNGTLTIMRKD